MTISEIDREALAFEYIAQLPFEPYPFQEEAIFAWFESDDGVLVSAPTGTGKTLIAESALFEALKSDRVAYYTTPLIALTEQKFREIQEKAIAWGYDAEDVGLVTGNRSVNPRAKILVVVAEILLNRLLHPEQFEFENVTAVVMDEFHSFADQERGVVWELTLGLLPKHIRLLLISATVGNTAEFLGWLRKSHDRNLRRVESTDRMVPLEFQWVGDQLLSEQIEILCAGDEADRRTPALLFCFSRSQCWSVAEQLKGRTLVDGDTKKELQDAVNELNLDSGAGPKLKRILMRGVGIHHAGILPRYRRVVEDLFQRKLLAVTVCTETLAAGINLPARAVVMTSLIKGPPGKKKLVEPSSAHQIFGRAGRPQFDSKGYVFALAHDDDVKIHRWQEKYDQLPEDSPDPNIRRAKKSLKKKKPTRRTNAQYWSEKQFEFLRNAPPGKLTSRGIFPWRMLGWLLSASPSVESLQQNIRRRLTDEKTRERTSKDLKNRLKTLWAGGYLTLDPPPPQEPATETADNAQAEGGASPAEETPQLGTLGSLLSDAMKPREEKPTQPKSVDVAANEDRAVPRDEWEPRTAHPTDKLSTLMEFRSINPIYGCFVLDYFDQADSSERLQILESVLEMSGSVASQVRVPRQDVLPQGPLATEFLNEVLLTRGLAVQAELDANVEADEDDDERRWVKPLADKLRLFFQSEFPGVHDLRVRAVWCVGDLMTFGDDFDKYVRSRDLAKEEGILFRHCLRFGLLCGEFRSAAPAAAWSDELREWSDRVVAACRSVDPESTDKFIESAEERV